MGRQSPRDMVTVLSSQVVLTDDHVRRSVPFREPERVESPAAQRGHAEPEPWARRATASQPQGLASRLGPGVQRPPECVVSQDPAAAPWAELTPESPVSTGGLVPWSCPASWRPPPTRPDRLSAHLSPVFHFSISELLGPCPSHHLPPPWSSQVCVSSGLPT